MLESRKW